MTGENSFNQNLLTNDPENTKNNDGNQKKTEPVDVSSNVWRLFLDSKCSSATVFFRLHLSAHSYFHSPTPWNPGSNSTLPRKVAKLLDSFRPGSSSYSPFQSPTDVNNNTVHPDHNRTNENAENITEFNLLRPSEISPRGSEVSSSSSSISTDFDNSATHTSSTPEANIEDNISPEEVNRRRLYLNFGRPRPFYRVPSISEVIDNKNQATNSKKKRVIKTLQEEARNRIVTTYGLTNLSKIVKSDKLSRKLPQVIQNFLLTFPCQDFEEVGSDRPNKSASYNVRCNLDGQNYTAVFALSEVDKNVGNLWEDDAKWLKLADPGVTQILAIAVDPLTENIFYIIPERGIPISEIINNSSNDIDMGNSGTLKRPDLVNTICISVLATIERLYQSGLGYGQLREENIFLCQSKVLLENPLMVKSSSPYLDLDHLSTPYSSEKVCNLHKFGIILARILDPNTEYVVSHEGCLKLAEKIKTLEHSSVGLVIRLLTDPQNFVN